MYIDVEEFFRSRLNTAVEGLLIAVALWCLAKCIAHFMYVSKRLPYARALVAERAAKCKQEVP